MPLGIGTALWGVVLPVEKTNYFANPSYEFGSAGGTAIAAATIGTSSQYQQFGAWSLAVTPGVNGTAGAILGTWAAQTGTTYTASAYVRADVAFYTLALADGAGLNFVASGSVDFAGGGTWQRYSITYTENSNTNRALVLRKNGGANVLPFYADGVQVETGNLTTFFSGDDGGGTWLGAQQASQSLRSGQYRGGGSVVALADLGLSPDQFLGAGVPPIEVSTQSYAVTDGAQFQRQRAAQRDFTLTGKPINGTSLADFHVTRRTLYDAFKPDLVSTQQPVRFVYVGAQGSQQIDAYYKKGLELGNMDGPVAESVAITFTAPDPYWYAPTQQGTQLGALVQLGSVNYLARRSPLGAWGTMGQSNGTTVLNPATGVTAAWTLAFNPAGTLFVGGNWGTLSGTVAPHIGMYFPATNTFGTLTGGTIQAAGGPVYAIVQNPGGTLFIGGFYLNAAGTTVNGLSRWNGAFGSLVGGTVAANSQVLALVYSPTGTLFAGGIIPTFAGTTNSANAGMWTGAAFGTLGGTVNQSVNDMAWGLDNRLFLGGAFTTVNGVQGSAIAQWKSGTLGTMNSFNNAVNALGVGPNGYLYEAGLFDVVAGGSALKSAVWNGIQHSALGYGLGGAFGAQAIIADQRTGGALFAGRISGYGSVNIGGTVQYSVWTGAAWLPPDIRIVSNGYAYAAIYGPDNSLYLGGEFTGTAYAASVGTVMNTGRAEVFPTLRMRNVGGGTASIFQLRNNTTGDGIYFQTVLLSGEQAVLSLQLGSRAYTSSFRGNILGDILPGSNLATWSLLPGTNYVSFFSDSGSVEASLYWQPKGWAIDSGTIF